MSIRRYYFFDLDGTLADTDPDIRGAWKTVLSDMGLECPEFDEKFIAGPPFDVMLKTLFPTQYTDAMADEVRGRFGKVYDNCGFRNTPEYPGVMDAVRSIKARGDRVFIVTNKRILGAKALAAKYGWMDVFEGMYTGDMFEGKRMLKPELLKYVIETLGVEKEKCVMIGDSISDFEAAKANGIRSVGVTWGYGKDDLKLADRVITEPEELLGV